MRRLITSRLIWIYTVCNSVLAFDLHLYVQQWKCQKFKYDGVQIRKSGWAGAGWDGVGRGRRVKRSTLAQQALLSLPWAKSVVQTCAKRTCNRTHPHRKSPPHHVVFAKYMYIIMFFVSTSMSFTIYSTYEKISYLILRMSKICGLCI